MMVAFAEERGDRCFQGKKGYYYYKYGPHWEIDESSVTGPFETAALAHGAAIESEEPAVLVCSGTVSRPKVDDLRVNIAPQFALQTWNGERYYTQQMEDTEDDIWRHMLAHIRSMPNCPARIVRTQIIGEYHP
jgi:hypothetical protein